MSNTTTAESRHARARLAVAVRDHGPEGAATVEAREHYRSEKYLAAVRAAVADAPKLTSEQRDRLARILAPVVVALDVPEPNETA